MTETPKQWKWYHYAVSIFAWIFLFLVHFVWVVGPWYLVVSEYLDLKNGIDVQADYQNSSAIFSDTKLDHEKEYRYFYQFKHPTTGETIEYSIQGTGRDNYPGKEIHLKFNPETGSVGYSSILPILFSKLKFLMASIFGIFWVYGIFFRRNIFGYFDSTKSNPKKQKKPKESRI